MKDFLGNELEIDDKVAVSRKPYHELRKMFVIGFTEKSIRVSKIKGGLQEEGTQPYFPRYVVKVFNQDLEVNVWK